MKEVDSEFTPTEIRQMENLMKNVVRLYNGNKTDEAYKICLEVRRIDPHHPEATAYEALCDGWTTSVANPRVDQCAQGILEALDYGFQKYGPSEEYDNLAKIALHSCQIFDAYSNLCSNHADTRKDIMEGKVRYAEKLNSQGLLQHADMGEIKEGFAGAQNKYREALGNAFNAGLKSINLTNAVLDAILQPFGNDLKNLGFTVVSLIATMHADTEAGEKCTAFIKKQFEERVAEYWDNHPKEKSKLDAELTKLESEESKVSKTLAEQEERLNKIEDELFQATYIEQNRQIAAKKVKDLSTIKIHPFNTKAAQDQINELDQAIKNENKLAQNALDELKKKADECLSDYRELYESVPNLKTTLETTQTKIKETKEELRNPQELK